MENQNSQIVISDVTIGSAEHALGALASLANGAVKMGMLDLNGSATVHRSLIYLSKFIEQANETIKIDSDSHQINS